MNSTTDPSLLGGAGEANVSHGPKLLAATLVVTAAALISVSMRMWVRKMMKQSVGWDDGFICAAMMVSLICEGLVIPEVYYGAGRHAVYLTNQDEKSYGLYLNFVSQPIFLVGVVLVKVSIGLFLLRLTPFSSLNRFIWAMIVFMFLYTTAALKVTVVIQCRPLTVLWKPDVQAVCFSTKSLRAAAYFNAACSIFTDLVCALLPIHILWNVRMNRRVKFAVLCILALGIFASAACIVKVYYLEFYGRYGDFLWDSVNLTIWTSCELNIGIFAASIATLRPLFRAAFHNDSANMYASTQPVASVDKHSFARHISNSRGASKVGDPIVDEEEGLEMYGSSISCGKHNEVSADNSSQEMILPLQEPGTIVKTTQVDVSVDQRIERPPVSLNGSMTTSRH